jgi:hypothetical protein
MQLEMFQTCPEFPEPPQIWKDENQEQRTIVVNMLARLMVKAVRQETTATQNE